MMLIVTNWCNFLEIPSSQSKPVHHNVSHVYDVPKLNLELSDIKMAPNKHISMMLNREDTEVEENEIYLRHFFRVSQRSNKNESNNQNSDYKTNSFHCSQYKAHQKMVPKRAPKEDPSKQKYISRSSSKRSRLNNTLYGSNQSRYNAYDDTMGRDCGGAYSSVNSIR